MFGSRAPFSLGVVLLGCLPLGAPHGSVLFPPPRNAIDAQLEPWRSHANTEQNTRQFPLTGRWKYLPFGCDCTNGTAPCEAGQSCYWFSGLYHWM